MLTFILFSVLQQDLKKQGVETKLKTPKPIFLNAFVCLEELLLNSFQQFLLREYFEVLNGVH